MIRRCHWCRLEIINGHENKAQQVDWETGGGDSGCGEHPISGEDGVGPHETDEEVRQIVRSYHETAMAVHSVRFRQGATDAMDPL